MNYGIYKFYKGEKEAPENLDAEQERLWNAERVFEDEFRKNDSADWNAFFADCEVGGKNAGKIFMEKLGENEYERPADTSKAWIFDLWLDYYLFVDKFPREWKKYYKAG